MTLIYQAFTLPIYYVISNAPMHTYREREREREREKSNIWLISSYRVISRQLKL